MPKYQVNYWVRVACTSILEAEDRDDIEDQLEEMIGEGRFERIPYDAVDTLVIDSIEEENEDGELLLHGT